LAGFGKKETYGLADFFEAYPEKTEKTRSIFVWVVDLMYIKDYSDTTIEIT